MRDLLIQLRNSSLFDGLEDFEILEFIQQYPCKIVEYSQEDCIIEKDEEPHFIGIVLEGTLGIYTDSVYGGHTLIGIGDRNYFFGYIARFFNESRSITSLYCRKYCKVSYFQIPNTATSIDFISRTNNRILSNIYAMLTLHIKNDFERMHIISSNSVRVKLTRYLIYQSSAAGGTDFQLPYSRTELANFLGVYRTSLSHELQNFIKRGVISLDKKNVRILDMQALIKMECDSYD